MVPHDLEIDLFEGKPWVYLVAFTMEKIRPKYLPSFPPISDFDEINIRTYVKKDNKAGVYFLSINPLHYHPVAVTGVNEMGGMRTPLSAC